MYTKILLMHLKTVSISCWKLAGAPNSSIGVVTYRNCPFPGTSSSDISNDVLHWVLVDVAVCIEGLKILHQAQQSVLLFHGKQRAAVLAMGASMIPILSLIDVFFHFLAVSIPNFELLHIDRVLVLEVDFVFYSHGPSEVESMLAHHDLVLQN